MGNKHRYLGSILARVEYLADHEGIGIEIDLRLPPELALTGGQIITVDATGNGEAGKTEESFSFLWFASKPGGGANSWESDFADRMTLQIDSLNLASGVAEVVQDELSAHQGYPGQGGLPFRHPFLPLGSLGLSGIDGDHPAPGCLEVRVEEKDRANIADKGIAGVEIIEQFNHRSQRGGQVLVVDTILGVGTFMD